MQVNLTWAAVTNALYFNVYRGTVSGGPYNFIGQSNPNPGQNPSLAQVQNSYQDGPGNLPNQISQFYVVTTVTVDGESAYSAQITATAPVQPPAPTGLAVVVT